MWLYQSMKAHLKPRRLARDVLLAALCALLLASPVSAMSRTRLQVTVPDTEGHPRGDYSSYMASAPRISSRISIWQWLTLQLKLVRIPAEVNGRNIREVHRAERNHR